MYLIRIILDDANPCTTFFLADKGIAFNVARLLSFDCSVLAVEVEDENGKIILEI